ncbi:MAG: hypothetical protein WC389_20085 [Lutibacter sp.]|jgi:hypothetical protein
MKYIYILTWCVLYKFSTDSTIFSSKYKVENDCENKEVYIYKSNAEKREKKLYEEKNTFNGFITYENIHIDSVLVDTAYKDETLIKLYK